MVLRLLLLLPAAMGLALILFRLRRRRQRYRFPRDYAYFLLHHAQGPDYYAYLKNRIPRLTPTRYQRLVLEFRAVNATLLNLARRQSGEPFSSKTVAVALLRLHPFLKHEGLRQAIREARARHAELNSNRGGDARAEAARLPRSPARTEA